MAAVVAAPLPSPRAVITSIVDSATPDARPALLTLHALFPAALLPALDLLDRGLVTKLKTPTPRTGAKGQPDTDGIETHPQSERSVTSRLPGQGLQPQDLDVDVDPEPPPLSQFSTAHAILASSQQQQRYQNPHSTNPAPTVATSTSAPSNQTQEQSPSTETGLYIVRSAQTPTQHRTSSTSSFTAPGLGGSTYEVRLNAWNCSCAAFTFAAFPANRSSGRPSVNPPGGAAVIADAELEDLASKAGLFGGLGVDMPVCKHLLACVLAERGRDVTGEASFARYVEEKVVSFEEIAGWAAGWGD